MEWKQRIRTEHTTCSCKRPENVTSKYSLFSPLSHCKFQKHFNRTTQNHVRQEPPTAWRLQIVARQKSETTKPNRLSNREGGGGKQHKRSTIGGGVKSRFRTSGVVRLGEIGVQFLRLTNTHWPNYDTREFRWLRPIVGGDYEFRLFTFGVMVIDR